MNVVTATEISLGIADKPITGLHVQQAAICPDVRRFFHLNGIHQQWLDCSVNHMGIDCLLSIYAHGLLD